jgi:hypothetical protein
VLCLPEAWLESDSRTESGFKIDYAVPFAPEAVFSQRQLIENLRSPASRFLLRIDPAKSKRRRKQKVKQEQLPGLFVISCEAA